MRWVFLACALFLAGCATVPRHTTNACALFDEKDGFFNNWRDATRRAEARWGVPAPILLATIYTESGFRSNARPPRKMLLGFIPWSRRSSAYGYSQALDGTWSHYVQETGRFSARRSSFADAVDFAGWFHRKSHDMNGIALNDPYNLYLAYHSGQAGYAKRSYVGNADALKGAERFTRIAYRYAGQLRTCPN